MKTCRLLIFPLLLASAIAAETFKPAGWIGYKTLLVAETAGVARDNDPVDVSFSVSYETTIAAAALRIVSETGTGLAEVPAQFYDVHTDGRSVLSGSVVFLCPMLPNEKKSFRLYFGDPGAGTGRYEGSLSVKPAPKGPIDGPRHWMIENDFYRIETYPRSGQIWHTWNKRGSDRMWWFKEWEGHDQNGGDPEEWTPNVWVAYPDRVNPTPGNPDMGKKVFTEPLDWNYAIGWVEPKTEIIEGPLFFQVKSWGPVPAYPEHADPSYDRPTKDIVWGEVTHRFYAGLPWYYQSSTFITLEDMDVYFIRNDQTVFNDSIFSYVAIRPETPGLLPGDRDETCILPLMGHFNRMAFSKMTIVGGVIGEGHSLSNILPSKFGYYSFFNPQDGDAYANFSLLERNSMTTGGNPTMLNHHMTLTEGYGSAVDFARTFDYSNLRYNPENVTFLPKGQKFEEENIHLIYRYEGLQSLDALEHFHETFKHPLVASWISAP